MNKWINWISTGLLSAMMVMSAGMYLFNTAEIQQTFESLGYPSYIVIPLAVAKIIGVVVLWVSKNRSLKDWAYAGFFFDFVLAFFAHIMISDGQFGGAFIALILLAASYYSWKKLSAE